jgi:hypothetical protein
VILLNFSGGARFPSQVMHATDRIDVTVASVAEAILYSAMRAHHTPVLSIFQRDALSGICADFSQV